MSIRSKTAAIAAAALLSAMANAAGAADITVVASTAMREVMEELVPMFERATGSASADQSLLIPGMLSGRCRKSCRRTSSIRRRSPASAQHHDAAKALAKFLTSETAVPVMKKLGLDPA